jgi:hypothetical protein
MPNIQRALEILAEREVAPQLGLLKSTLLQLDATFSERDFGAGSFLDFIQKLRKAGLVEMRRTDRGYLVETVEPDGTRETAPELPPEGAPPEPDLVAAESPAGEAPAPTAPTVAPEATTPPAPPPQPATPDAILATLRQALPGQFEKAPNRPLYLRQIRQLLRSAGILIDERTGFRGLLDVLHQAQREGWLRLHRDRKGVWRTFPAAAPVPAPAVPPETGAEAVTEAPPEVSAELEPELEPEFAIPVESDVIWDAEEFHEQIVEPGPPTPTEETVELVESPAPTPPVVEEEVVLIEPPAQPRVRKRASKPGAKTATRKAAPRRKSKKDAEPGA